MSSWTDEYTEMITDCEKRTDKLSDWELGFLASMRLQLSQGKISSNQISKLEEVWEKATACG